MTGRYAVVQQIGDATFQVGAVYPTLATAFVAAVDTAAASDVDVEVFVDTADPAYPAAVTDLEDVDAF